MKSHGRKELIVYEIGMKVDVQLSFIGIYRIRGRFEWELKKLSRQSRYVIEQSICPSYEATRRKVMCSSISY